MYHVYHSKNPLWWSRLQHITIIINPTQTILNQLNLIFRYVIVGNHRDAWGFGAVDPSSGTAQMTEVIRVLGEKVKNEKWRPRRTIVFASWAAEEYGLTGSREFVEDFVAKLSQRAVVYLNVDICSG